MNCVHVVDDGSFRWRRPARIVAYLDLVFTGIGIVAKIVIALCVAKATAIVVSGDPQDRLQEHGISKEEAPHFVVSWWAEIVLDALLASVDLWSAVMLLKATTVGSDIVTAWKRAYIWRNVSIAFIIIHFCRWAGPGALIALLFIVLIRVMIICVIVNFIAELGSAIAAANRPNPSTVTAHCM